MPIRKLLLLLLLLSPLLLLLLLLLLSLLFYWGAETKQFSRQSTQQKIKLPSHNISPEVSPYSVNLRIQSECRRIGTRNNSVFEHFSRSVSSQIYPRMNRQKILDKSPWCITLSVFFRRIFLRNITDLGKVLNNFL